MVVLYTLGLVWDFDSHLILSLRREGKTEWSPLRKKSLSFALQMSLPINITAAQISQLTNLKPQTHPIY